MKTLIKLSFVPVTQPGNRTDHGCGFDSQGSHELLKCTFA